MIVQDPAAAAVVGAAALKYTYWLLRALLQQTGSCAVRNASPMLYRRLVCTTQARVQATRAGSIPQPGGANTGPAGVGSTLGMSMLSSAH